MESDALETFYDRLADAIDEVGPERTPLFLSKLALLLAREIPDAGEKAHAAVDAALKNL